MVRTAHSPPRAAQSEDGKRAGESGTEVDAVDTLSVVLDLASLLSMPPKF